MTSGELRILILVLGLLFIAAVYLWERHKRIQKDIRKKREYTDVFDDPDSLDEQINELDELVTSREKNIPYIQAVNPDSRDEEPEFGSVDSMGETGGSQPSRTNSLEDTILVISVASNKKYFSGDAIMSAMRSLDLVPGPMDVFYRYDNTQQNILYSIASMVEPGTFPVNDMSRFTTSGLTLFGRLPSTLPGSKIFEDMFEAAQQLAAQLDGKLLDSRHQPFSEEINSRMQELASSYPAQSE
jgi:cell division protein ZipA